MIGILQVGTAPQPLLSKFGDYSTMISNLLMDVREDLEFQVFRVLDGQFPDSPEVCDAWIISGSRFSVTTPLPWMNRLIEFIVAAASQEIRMVGICFGHQIMAAALGGTVRRSDHGWIVGRQEYQLRDSQGNVSSIALRAFHEDQVVSLPTNARVSGYSHNCPFAILEYGDFALSIQAHPEFSLDYTSALVSHRLKGKMAPDELDQTLENLKRATDSRFIAELIVGKLS